MEVKDFTEIEQKQIKAGLSEAVISDKAAADKILALVPQEWIKRIPFFVRGHATTKTIERIAHQFPDLYAVATSRILTSPSECLPVSFIDIQRPTTSRR